MGRRSILPATVWVTAMFVAAALPFVVLMTGERVPTGDFLWNLSKGLGFGALAMAGLQFVLTARFRRMTHPFGIDIVYLFHRYLAIGALALMLGHFGILYLWYEEALGVLNPLEARWELTAGRVALVSFAALVISSEFRKWLRIEYELWRYLHVGLAVLAFSAAILHVLGVGHFTAAAQTRALWLGVTLGFLVMLAWVRIVKPWQQRQNGWRLVDNIEERGGVRSLVFEPEGRGLRRWKPGQFVWLTLENSAFGLREHPFTIASAPEDAPRVTLSIKALGDFTERATATQAGARGHLDGPYGAFSIDNEPGAGGFVMIAGGIGITPMLANLRAMRARGDRRPVVLFYANSRWDDVAFREELDAMKDRLDLALVHVLEDAPEGWDGEKGYLTREVLERHLPPESRDWPHLLCGPPPMTDAARKALLEIGVPLSAIDSELFDMV